MNHPYQQEGYELVGAAFEVFNELGYGMAEEIYQESMELELEDREIPFDTKRQLRVWFKQRELKRKYIPDLYVFDSLVVELKSVAALNDSHDAQLYNYMRIARQPVGYLLNFGSKGGLEWRRLLLTDVKQGRQWTLIHFE